MTRWHGHQAGSALVIGAGVSGLTTAAVLARRGWRVTVAAAGFDRETVSTVTGALWEWPPSVCGRHHDEPALGPSKRWAMISYRRFEQLARYPGRTGVYLRPAVFYFPTPVAEQPAERAKRDELAAHLPGFRHDPALITEHGINTAAGVVDAYTYTAPSIDTDRYLAWLRSHVEDLGVRLVRRRITGSLVEQQTALRAEFGADVIVNCTGLGSSELAGDVSLSPHRGALLRVRNDGTTFPRITTAHAVANDPATAGQNMIFIVPPGEDRLLLGGIVEDGQWRTDLTLQNYSPLREMWQRSTDFLPLLRDAVLDDTDPLRVGLRPFRAGGVRLQAEPGAPVVHNYGHGGAGITLSWGCANEVADLADRLNAGMCAA